MNRRGSTMVYQAFDDRRELLYVGITNDLRRRMNEHRSYPSGWWSEHRSVDVLVFPSRIEAKRTETELIARHQPRFNVIGTDRHSEFVAASIRAAKLRKAAERREPRFIASPTVIERWLSDDEVETIDLLIAALRFIRIARRPNGSRSGWRVDSAFRLYGLGLDFLTEAIETLGYNWCSDGAE